MMIKADEQIQLEIISQKHAAPLFNLINNNRKHLSAFLPWVKNMQSVADLKDYIKSCISLHKQQKEVSFVILHNGIIVGRIGLHHMNILNKSAAIGYWLSKDSEGKGIISRSCIALIDHGFNVLGLHRIEIKAAVKNIKSQAIPERFHFTKEGMLREAEWVNNKFVDLFIYSMLRKEWKAMRKVQPFISL